jgi:signal transduction histidine kinase
MTEWIANRRILVIDDNQGVHESFRKVLCPEMLDTSGLGELEQSLLGTVLGGNRHLPQFEMFSAYQGDEAVRRVGNALESGQPFAMAFVDVRMPPGMDGIETSVALWKADPDLQVVICTAYSDYSWDEIMHRLGYSHRLVILKKPFENIEVLQMACSFTEKWNVTRQARLRQRELESSVNARTKELLNANIELHREMKDRSNAEKQLHRARQFEVVGQVSAGVAQHIQHATSIVGESAGKILDRAPDVEGVRSSVEQIRNAVDRAGNVVRQLLAFSQKLLVQPVETNINALLDSLMAKTTRTAGPACRIEWIPGSGLPRLMLDPRLFQEVLHHLVSNARDAMKNGGAIRIETALDDVTSEKASRSFDARPGRFVRITIQDGGCGIDTDVVDKMFTPFFSTKEMDRGIGLGLSVAYGIIRQHEGWIDVESAHGRGTSVHVFLPAPVED